MTKQINNLKKEFNNLESERKHWEVKEGSIFMSYLFLALAFLSLIMNENIRESFPFLGMSIIFFIFINYLKKRRYNNYLRKLNKLEEKYNWLDLCKNNQCKKLNKENLEKI